jgi:hypothetical protein
MKVKWVAAIIDISRTYSGQKHRDGVSSKLRSVSCSHEVMNTNVDTTATRAIKGWSMKPLRSGLWDMTSTEGQIVMEITGSQNGCCENGREETGMTGKHLITDTFTDWWRHMCWILHNQLTRPHDSLQYRCLLYRYSGRLYLTLLSWHLTSIKTLLPFSVNIWQSSS